MPKRDGPYNGLLIVDKPGLPSTNLPTSHDVVAMVRRWTGQRRIGHTGTLDPMASGVLTLCLGRATRLVEYYQGHDKQYLAEVALGSATDTYDAMGDVTDTAPVPELGAPIVEQALSRFRGEITQIPPAYSAIKVQGEALHRKARRGETVSAPPRQVTIRRLDLLELTPNAILRIRILCSAGAYVRSLAHDLGIALGTFAHLAGLRREAAGPFTLQDSHTLEEINRAADCNTLASMLAPMGTGLGIPEIHVDDDMISRFGYGQQVAVPSVAGTPGAMAHAQYLGTDENSLAQAIAPDGTLAGIIQCVGPGEPQGSGTLWRATKWLRPG